MLASQPVNAGAAEATGFETQATWRLADGLSVFGSYAYNHARFSGGAYDGNRFRSSPDDKFAFGVNAVIPTRLGELLFGIGHALAIDLRLQRGMELRLDQRARQVERLVKIHDE